MTAPDETAAASRGRKLRSPEAQLQRREEIMRSALACFKRKGVSQRLHGRHRPRRRHERGKPLQLL